jgi:hypothetical protein
VALVLVFRLRFHRGRVAVVGHQGRRLWSPASYLNTI